MTEVLKAFLAEPIGQFALLFLGAALGTLTTEVVSAARNLRRTRTQLRDNLDINLSGEWFGPLVVSCGTQQSKSRSSWSPVGMWAGCV